MRDGEGRLSTPCWRFQQEVFVPRAGIAWHLEFRRLVRYLLAVCWRLVFSKKRLTIPHVSEMGPGFESLAAHHGFLLLSEPGTLSWFIDPFCPNLADGSHPRNLITIWFRALSRLAPASVAHQSTEPDRTISLYRFFGMVQISLGGFLPLSIWTRYFRLDH